MMTLGLVIAISNPGPTAAQLPLPLHTWREVGCNCAILRLHPSAFIFFAPPPCIRFRLKLPPAPATLKLALGKDRNTFTLRTPDLNPLMSFCILEKFSEQNIRTLKFLFDSRDGSEDFQTSWSPWYLTGISCQFVPCG